MQSHISTLGASTITIKNENTEKITLCVTKILYKNIESQYAVLLLPSTSQSSKPPPPAKYPSEQASLHRKKSVKTSKQHSYSIWMKKKGIKFPYI